MTRLKWTLPTVAAILVGCGGDTGTPQTVSTKPDNKNYSGGGSGGGPKPQGKKAPDATTAAPKGDAAKPAPVDVSEPPPPKAVSDKDKASKTDKPADDPKAPPPVNKSTPEKKDG